MKRYKSGMTDTALEMQMFIARGMSLIIAMRTEGIRCFHRRIIGPIPVETMC